MSKIVQEQEWLAHEITPSGIEIRYGVKPKRCYQIRKTAKSKWRNAPSVTTVLDVLQKGGLTIWGQRVGIQGVLTLYQMGELQAALSETGGVLACIERVPHLGPLALDENGQPFHTYAPPEEKIVIADVPRVEALLKQYKLTTSHVRDAAGDRGQNVHDAFEAWAKEGTMPNPDLFPASEQGYVAGLRKFIEESGAVAVANEVMVGSVKWGYAGRFDVRLEIPADKELVVHHTPVRGEKRAAVELGVWLADLKTSRNAYPAHALQLAAYEAASIECGYEPTVGRAVIHVDSEGHYKFVKANATATDFVQVVRVWKTLKKELLG